MINEILSRQLLQLPKGLMARIPELYSVVASESSALQQAAYGILHDRIPREQEQKSLDKALAKDYTARIPEELLSLILAPPDEEYLALSGFERSIPLSLRTYLLSWKLVFDHWTNASYALQADYAASLKDEIYLSNLLDFTASFLVTGRIKAFDASRFDIMDFSPEEGESPERDAQVLLVHIYTLCLICLPNLSKTWWRDSKSRQTTIDVESWTEKYVSSSIYYRKGSSISLIAEENMMGPPWACAEEAVRTLYAI